MAFGLIHTAITFTIFSFDIFDCFSRKPSCFQFNAFVMFLTMKAFVSVKVFKDKNDKDKFK